MIRGYGELKIKLTSHQNVCLFKIKHSTIKDINVLIIANEKVEILIKP